MRLFLSIFLIFAVVPVVDAQDASRSEDRATIDRCLEQQRDSPERCVTAVFKPCTEAPQGPKDQVPHDSTAGQVECFNREMAVWDEKMKVALQRLLAGPLGKQIVKPEYRPRGNERKQAVAGADIIDDMQKTWLAARVKICDTESMFYEEGTFATIVFGNCVLKETGRHVIWLLDLVNDTTGR
jgi:uncharacterized protein YecT (DUF1311 family)